MPFRKPSKGAFWAPLGRPAGSPLGASWDPLESPGTPSAEVKTSLVRAYKASEGRIRPYRAL